MKKKLILFYGPFSELQNTCHSKNYSGEKNLAKICHSTFLQGCEREKAESLQLLRVEQAGESQQQLMGRGNRKRKKRKFFDDTNGGGGGGGEEDEEGEWEERRSESRSPLETAK